MNERSTNRRGLGLLAGRSAFPVLFVAVLVDSLGFGMTIPVLPMLVRSRGSGAVIVGALGSLFAVAQLVGMPLLGGLSDRVGRRPVILLSMLGTGGAFVLLALARTNSLVLAAILLDGLTAGAITAAQAHVADSSAGATRAHRIALLGLAQGAGMLAGPALGGLIGATSAHLVPLAAAGLAGANFLLAAIGLPEPVQRRRGAGAESIAGLRAAARIFREEHRPLRAAMAVVVLVNLAFVGVPLNLPVLARARFGWGGPETGALLAAGGLCAALTQGLLVRELRRVRSAGSLVRYGTLAVAGLLPLVGMARTPPLLFAGVCLLAVAASTTIPSLTEVVTRSAPEGRHGFALGAMNAAVSTAMAFGPLSMGLLYEHLHPAAPYVLGGALALAAAAAAARLDRGRGAAATRPHSGGAS